MEQQAPDSAPRDALPRPRNFPTLQQTHHGQPLSKQNPTSPNPPTQPTWPTRDSASKQSEAKHGKNASHVHGRRGGHAALHAQEGGARAGDQVGAPGALLARRQVVAAAGDAEAALRAAADAAGGRVNDAELDGR
ncbi:Uncharacterized protein TPAR_00047 [Tolypocladium paradoxum]|uniref:Uncharacterized protein n=1 Tax=Tolypocladium paradoxum TaxID=94208 RepID=A0A2S4LBG1_9HYPO|nr:Uncharacterized protein TPAR_00047 [Tolypocladium paradoxum]